MDQFGININRATHRDTNNELNNTQGIFIEQNSRGATWAGDLLKYDQLLKITWTRPSQNSPMTTVDLTGDIDNIQDVVRDINQYHVQNLLQTVSS